jgi:hypothetical protein
LEGHLRVALALSSNQKSIPVEYVDLSEPEEAEVLATIYPIAALAATDREQLGALVADIDHADGAVAELLGEMYGENPGAQGQEDLGSCPECGRAFKA